jgi:hypothetical protein
MGRPIPNPSYNLLVASSRGERGGISCEDGVVGEPPDLDDPEDDASSASTSEESMAITGRGCDTARLKRRGWGRDLVFPEDNGMIDSEGPSPGGGVTLTDGGDAVKGVALFGPPSIELFFPPLLQEIAESDLEGTAGELELMLLDKGLPRTVPPLMTVVRLGVWGGVGSSWASSSWALRLPNLPLSAAVIGSS